MSLEELRAQIAAEEAESDEQTLEVEETEEEETEDDADNEAESEESEVESEESGDFELEIEGEEQPQGPTAEEALIHKLNKQRKRAKNAEDENTSLKKRIEDLEKRLTQTSTPQPAQQSAAMPVLVLPDLYDSGIDGNRDKYNQAVNKAMMDYEAAKDAYKNRHASAEQAQADQTKRMEEITGKLATSVAKFARENKISDDRVINALTTATDEIDAVTGLDGSMAHLLDSLDSGAERAAYYIGTNEAARERLKSILQTDKTGLKAVAYLSSIASKVKPKQKILSKAPEPDTAIKGDAVDSATAKQIQSMWDKETDTTKLLKIKQRARELGVKLA